MRGIRSRRRGANRSGLDEWVGGSFFADGGGRAVARENSDIIGERVELGPDRIGECFKAGVGEVGASDGAGEEGIADECDGVLIRDEGEAAGGVTGCVQHVPCGIAERECFALCDEAIGSGDADWLAEEGAEVELRVVEPALFVFVDPDGRIRVFAEDVRDAGDMVGMGVCQDDGFGGEPGLSDEFEQGFGLVAGVDDPEVIASLDGVAIGLVGAERDGSDREIGALDHEIW